MVQLILQAGKLGQLVQLLELAICLVSHQRTIKVDGKDDEDYPEGDHDGGGGDGRSLTGGDGAVAGLHVGARLLLQRVEFDPTEKHHLGQEEQSPDDGGEGPSQLNVAVHALVGRLLDRVEVVDVADSLNVGQDAGADHQGKEVDGHQDGRASAEGYQESRRVVVFRI